MDSLMQLQADAQSSLHKIFVFKAHLERVNESKRKGLLSALDAETHTLEHTETEL